MENQRQLTQNGQEIRQSAYNDLGSVAALADDRVLAELLRLAPYSGSVTRVIFPYASGASGSKGTVEKSGAADGSVKVNPFRAVIGARTAEATDAKKSWRDIRSGIYLGGTTARQGTVTFGANASGNPRWDLIQAVVAVDANGPSENQFVKNPTTEVVTSTSVVPYLQTTVTVSVVAGTPAATPAFPSPTADGGGTYYIPIAYVRIPNGFTAGSTIAATDIAMVAPVAEPSRGGGAPRIIVPDQSYKKDGTILTSTNQGAWGASGAARPECYMNPDMFGGEILPVQINLTGPANYSHNAMSTGADSVIDSRDWRGRMFLVFVECEESNSALFPQANAAPAAVPIVGGSQQSTTGAPKALNARRNFGFGQSVSFDGAGRGLVCFFDTTQLSVMAASSDVSIYVDNNDSGKMKVRSPSGNWPDARFMFWIVSVGTFGNAF